MTRTRPTRDTATGRAYLDLRSLAKRNGREPAEYFTLYALEGFLARLARSDYAGDFVLKGGVLMAAFAARRPTRDIDLSATGFPNEVEDVAERVRTIAALDADDGVAFDPASVSGETIRDEADYAGVRVTLTARLATAKISLHVDVNFGDPIWPRPADTDVPLLLGGTVQVRGYPAHMVLAEKIVTAVDRGTANTRWRDFVDIVAITDGHDLRHGDLASAVESVAEYRKVTVAPLGVLLDGMADIAQRKWAAWRRKQQLEATTPERYQDILDQCIAFADPVLDGSGKGLTWSAGVRAWIDGAESGPVDHPPARSADLEAEAGVRDQPTLT